MAAFGLGNLNEIMTGLLTSDGPDARKAIDDYIEKNPEVKQLAKKVLRDPKRVILPGFSVRCSGTKKDFISQYFINVAKTNAIKQSTDDSDVSVIVSELRRSSSELYGPYHVVDCVVHTSIVAKQDPVYRTQLIDLCFNCVKEVLGIDINRASAYEIKPDTYMDPWGWNSDGSPISDSNPPEEIDYTPLESMTTSSLLQELAKSSSETLDKSSIFEEEPSRGVWIEELEDVSDNQGGCQNAQDDSHSEKEEHVENEEGLALT